ncbi:hypothetical protein GmHk_20G059088 [Glycine max]|nr:hypothetical protein GmHk_20G059088 [Glycine max]
MASKSNSEKLEDAIAKLTIHQLSLSENLQTMTHKLDTLISTLTTKSPAPSPSSPPHVSPTSPSSPHPRVKLDVPRFDGSDPLGWIFKITQYFEYHHTSDQDRLTIASFYMDGRALAWYQWMAVQAYLSEFEDLANRVVGLPPHFLLSCFVSGLNADIRREILPLQPLTVTQAAGLARLQEEKLIEARRPFRPRVPPAPSQPLPTNPFSPSLPSLPSNPTTKPLSVIPLKRLTPEELTARRERGLCFNCDERYHRGHRCNSRVHLLVADDDERPVEDYTLLGLEPEPPDPSLVNEAQLNLHSLTGPLAPETLRFSGLIADQQVLTLVDGGSTHNFVRGGAPGEGGRAGRLAAAAAEAAGTS